MYIYKSILINIYRIINYKTKFNIKVNIQKLLVYGTYSIQKYNITQY